MNTSELLNTAPCGFVSFGEDGTVELINDTLARMLGYEPEDLVGRHVERILTVGTRIFYQTHWFPLLRLHGRAEEIFLILRAESGEELGVLANAVRRERDGRRVFDCVLMRVRERQKFEEELLRARRTAERARADLEIQKKDLEEANARLSRQSAELERKQAALEDQAVELEVTTEHLREVNEELRARTSEAELLREEADKANLAKSQFLAMMSHELRTPLNAIGGYVQILEMGIHGPVTEQQLEALRRISRSQTHLLNLISDVLNLSRIEAGRVEYRTEDIAVGEVVDSVLPLVEPLLEQKRLTLEVRPAADLMFRADREKVQQILVNLLGNAVKFTPEGGRITLEAFRPQGDEEHLCLSVGDTGIGIPHEKLSTIFEPFVQVEGRRDGAEVQGSGLGLAISRDLARGMGGDLTAESNVGEGSTFLLTLPLPRESIAGHPANP